MTCAICGHMRCVVLLRFRVDIAVAQWWGEGEMAWLERWGQAYATPRVRFVATLLLTLVVFQFPKPIIMHVRLNSPWGTSRGPDVVSELLVMPPAMPT